MEEHVLSPSAWPASVLSAEQHQTGVSAFRGFLSHEHFLGILKWAGDQNPTFVRDLIASHKAETNDLPAMLLIEDGEISFWSLLWLFRHARRLGLSPALTGRRTVVNGRSTQYLADAFLAKS